MKTLRSIISLIIVVIVVGAGLFAAYKFSHMFDFLKRKPLAIEKTANVVEEVKKIGEFTTACYYEEMALRDSYRDTAELFGSNADVLASKATGNYNRLLGKGFSKIADNTNNSAIKTASNVAGNIENKIGNTISYSASKATAMVASSNNEIVLIGKGRVRAGFDLAKLQEEDFIVHGDTLELALPQAEVFDIIMNPSDFTTEYEKGTWSHELTKPIKERAKSTLEQNAIDYGILQKAEESGLKRLENLFKTFGFNTVLLTVK